MGRSMWTGVISFGMVSIPVKLHTATEGSAISFHQLHKKCDTRIKEVRYCPHCDRNVEWDEIVKGYEYEKNKYIELTAEDLEQLPLPSKHTIEVSSFVDVDDIDPIYFDSAYYLEIEKTGIKPYRLLVDALTAKKKAGIATIAFRNKERICALRPIDNALILQTLLYADEVKDKEPVPTGGAATTAQEKKMALALIEAMTSKFEPAKFKDNYQEALKKLIDAKLKGIVLEEPETREATPVLDLMAALKASMAKVSKETTTKSKSGGTAKKKKSTAASKSKKPAKKKSRVA